MGYYPQPPCPDPLTNFALYRKHENQINKAYKAIQKDLAPYPDYQFYFEAASADYYCFNEARITVNSDLRRAYRALLKHGPANVVEKYPSATRLEKFFESYSASFTGIMGSRSSLEQVSPHLIPTHHATAVADYIATIL